MTVIVPVRVAEVVGSKKTPTEQLAPGATLLPQALSELKSEGFVVIEEIVTGLKPLFVMVTDCGSPEVPTN